VRKDSRRHTLAPSEALDVPICHEALKAEVRSWAARLDAAPVEIRIVAMTRKWASCSSRGRLTFDVELLSQPEPFRREVIVHELLHLKVRNHGPLFRALLAAHLASP
jgi:hypothetical protein